MITMQSHLHWIILKNEFLEMSTHLCMMSRDIGMRVRYPFKR